MFLSCKDELEDEKHFITKCLYGQERALLFQACEEYALLFQACRQNAIHFDSHSVDQKFNFILTNESKEVTTELSKFVFNSFKIRDEAPTRSLRCLPSCLSGCMHVNFIPFLLFLFRYIYTFFFFLFLCIS